MLPRAAAAVAGALARAVLVVVLVASAVFVLADLLPGDAATRAFGREAATGPAAEQARAELGLDQPLPVRLGRWLEGGVRGDLGRTAHGSSVTDVLAAPFRRTLRLAALTIALVGAVSLLLGTAMAWRAGGSLDRAASAFTALTIGLPELVIVTFAVLVLATWAGLVPAVVVPQPDGGIPVSMLVVPVVALGMPLLAWMTRMVRASVLDAMEMPHVEMAALDGLSPARILACHVLPFALPAIAASFGVACVGVLSGAVVVEAYVNYPGLGSVLAAAVDARDIPLAAGTVAAVSAVMVLVLACADAARRLFPSPAQR